MTALISIALLVFVPFANGDIISVNTTTNRLQDNYGRERLFHGVNVVYKGTPWHPDISTFNPQFSFSEVDVKLLYSLGLNAVRLGLMWPGVEPQRGKYNQTYLDVMKQIVSTMSQYDIYALLDCHQDVLSQKFCGEGMPVWANYSAGKFPYPLDSPYSVNSSGIPSPNDGAKFGWMDYYVTEATSAAFQDLYDNYDDLGTSFADFWTLAAKTFQGFDNLLGYELLNEPWAGDIYQDPELLVPGQADIKNLQPFYQTLNAAIRSVDNEHSIFFEPVTWDDFGVGFTEVPGGPLMCNRSVLSYHFYIPPDFNALESFIVREVDVKNLNCGGFLTEFDFGSDIPTMIETLELADQFVQSWTGWEYKKFIPITGWNWGLFYSNGSYNLPVMKALSRTYPYAVAGNVRTTKFDHSTAKYFLEYMINPLISEPTEIYLNEALYYPNGFKVSISPANIATWKQTETNRIQVIHQTDNSVLLQLIITKM